MSHAQSIPATYESSPSENDPSVAVIVRLEPHPGVIVHMSGIVFSAAS